MKTMIPMLLKRILAVWLVSLATVAWAEWPGVKYAEVRAYAWPAEAPLQEVMLAGMKPAEGAVQPEGTRLSEAQVQRLLVAQARRSRERSSMACYYPHNAFVFFDAEQRPVAFLELCFDCRKWTSEPMDAESTPDLVELATIFAELKLPFGEYKTVKELRETIELARNPAQRAKPEPAEKSGRPGRKEKGGK